MYSVDFVISLACLSMMRRSVVFSTVSLTNSRKWLIVDEIFEDTTERRIILKQVGLITKATECMTEKVH